jgi:cyanoexosortase B-associated protein
MTIDSPADLAAGSGRFPWAHSLVGLLLLGLLATSLPGYLQGGRWSWQRPPGTAQLGTLRKLRETGIVVPGWQTQGQATFKLGNNKWSKQLLERPSQADPKAEPESAVLFLRAQHDNKTQPEVEWADFRGLNRWTEDEARSVTIRPGVTARLVRGWTRDRTHALLQWYAWPQGGSPTPIDWFVQDRQAQLRGDRVPWIAVSIVLPMEPLGDLAKVEAEAKALGGVVQEAIEAKLAAKAEAQPKDPVRPSPAAR